MSLRQHVTAHRVGWRLSRVGGGRAKARRRVIQVHEFQLLLPAKHQQVSGARVIPDTYDSIGNVVSSTDSVGEARFSCDALGRITDAGTSAAPESYTYDAVGNRETSHRSSTHVYDDANRLLEDGNFTYSYDANGNRATKTTKTGGSVTNYTFDDLNRLVQVDLPDGRTAIYRYDAFGQRIEKTVGGETTRYVYDGRNILMEFNGANALMARYTHGAGTDQVLIMERTGERYFYQADRLGSTGILTDAGGVVVNRYAYDASGRVIDSTEGVANPFTYTGREQDAETGLYYYRARFYDPETGRFLSEDPIGVFNADQNLFSYVGNNPLNANDPWGLTGPFSSTVVSHASTIINTGRFAAGGSTTLISMELPAASSGARAGATVARSTGTVVRVLTAGVSVPTAKANHFCAWFPNRNMDNLRLVNSASARRLSPCPP